MLRRIAAIAATSVVATMLATAPAFAAAPAGTATGTSTTITPDELVAALNSAITATGAAAAQGYGSKVTMAAHGQGTMSLSAVVDQIHGRAAVTAMGTTGYLAEGRGEWDPISEFDRSALKGELALLGKPKASYVLTVAETMSLSDIQDLTYAPSSQLRLVTQSIITSATKTVNDTDTTYVVYASTGPIGTYLVTLVVGTDGRLISETQRISMVGNLIDTNVTYSYGAHSIKLPSDASTVTDRQIMAAHSAIANFTKLVKARATAVATLAGKLAGKAHHPVSSADIRTAAHQVASAHAKDLIKVTTMSITGGVKLRAVNPSTGKALAFTVTVWHGKVFVKTA